MVNLCRLTELYSLRKPDKKLRDIYLYDILWIILNKMGRCNSRQVEYQVRESNGCRHGGDMICKAST